jgi:hypothetical protein
MPAARADFLLLALKLAPPAFPLGALVIIGMPSIPITGIVIVIGVARIAITIVIAVTRSGIAMIVVPMTSFCSAGRQEQSDQRQNQVGSCLVESHNRASYL